MITLYNEKGEIVKHISAFEFNDADMGESSISATILFDKEQDFHPDWYAEYNGEEFRLGVRKPTGKKDTSSLSTSYTLVFKSEREDLKRYTFMDFVELGTGNPQPNSYKVSLYATLSEFVHRFNVNLTYYMGQRWKMVLPEDYVESGNAVSAVFDNMSLWDVLLKVYEIWGVRWKIVPEADVLNIQVGFTADEIEHIFEYGKDNGLVSVERNNALERIITRLRGRGGVKNLPPDYFHQGDPDTNPFLQATFFQNLMPKAYRDYIRGYNAGSGEGSWAYNKGVADKIAGADIAPVDYVVSDKEDLWGISYGSIEPNEEIYPTLQGVERDGSRLDTVIAVEPVFADSPGIESDRGVDIRDDIRITSQGISLDGGNELYPSCKEPILITPAIEPIVIDKPYNTVALKFKLDSLYKIYSNVDNVLPAFLEQDVILEGSIELCNTDSAIVVARADVYNSDAAEIRVDNIPEGIYEFRINLQWYAINQSAGTVISCNFLFYDIKTDQYTSAATKEGYKPTFDIWIKDVWNISREAGETDADYTYRVWGPLAVSEEMTVMFSDGLLAGEDYEFRIVGVSSDADNLRSVIVSAIHPDDSMILGEERSAWRLTLQKSEAEVEASGRYLPNSMQNAQAGDHFFFVNIAMPYDPYVYEAEARVNAYLDEQLALKDEEFPSFTIAPSSIFCKDFAEIDKLKAGSVIRVRNLELIGDAYLPLHIQSVTKRYSDNKFNPDWTITVSDQIVASGNPVETLEGDVDILASQVYSNKEAVRQAIRQLSTTFLRKDGVRDTSYSPSVFRENVEVGGNVADVDFSRGDVNGKGFGVYTDGDGNRVVEADILIGRIGARFNEVHLNQATYSGGKQVFSAAGLQISRVEEIDGGWRCFFDNKNGSVRNLFVIGDGAYCQHFTLVGYTTYWRRVIGIGADYIDLSSTDCLEGSSIPMVGDEVAQLGNNADRSRQAALVIDVVRDGGGLVTWYDDITNFTLLDKESVNIGRMETDVQLEDGTVEKVWKTWLQVYGSAYIGDKQQEQYLQFDNGKLKVKGSLEVGSKISDAMTVVEDGIIQSTLLKLGYYEEGLFKVMSGTNGLYDSSAKGGGIAAWYGGPMIDKEANEEVSEFAEALFRFDGSGYLAGGNISWDKEGAGKVAGGDIFWDKDGNITLGVGIKISGDAEETLGSILTTVNKFLSWFGIDENEDIYVKRKSDGTPRNFYTYGTMSFGGIDDGESGEDGGTGITSLYNIPEIAVSAATLVDGQSLVYDATLGKWVNRLVQGGSGVDMNTVWAALADATDEKINASHIPDLSDVYLPLTGGTITGSITTLGTPGIIINREVGVPYIRFQNGADNINGELGVTTAGELVYYPTIESVGGYGKWNRVLHSGNIAQYMPRGYLLTSNLLTEMLKVDGSGSGLDADLLDGLDETRFFRRRSILYSYDSGSALPLGLYLLGNAESDTDSFPTGNGTFINLTSTDNSGAVGTNYGLQFCANYAADALYVRSVWYNSLKSWKQLAYVTSNVNSATKLQTARTIWGRTFDGTGNITSHLELGNSIAIKVTDKGDTLRNALVMDSYNSLLIGSGNVASDAGYMTHIYGKPIRFSISSSNHPVTITSNANVLIGTTNEDITYNEDTKYKLLVSGRGYFSAGATLMNGNAIYSKDTAGNDKALFLLNNANSFMIGSDIGAAEYSTYLYGHEILFRQKPGGAQPMYISSNGNVLIGYTTDDNTAKLNVQGKIRLSSDLLLNNYTAIKFKDSNGAELNTIMVGTDNAVTIGADHSVKNYETRIKGSGVTLFHGNTQVLSLTSASKISAKNILPFEGYHYDLGSSSNRWNTIYGTSLNLSGSISSGNILPLANNTYNLGTSDTRWGVLYAYYGSFTNGVNNRYYYTLDGTIKAFDANNTYLAIGDGYVTEELPVYINGKPIRFRASSTTDLTIDANGNAIFYKYLSSSPDGTHLLDWYGEGRFWNLMPQTTKAHNLGSENKRWASAHINDVVAYNSVKIGDATLVWDADNQCLVVDKNFAADGSISFGGLEPPTEDSYLATNGGTILGDLGIGNAANTGKNLNLYGNQYFWHKTTPTKGVYLFLDSNAGDRLALRNVDNSIAAKFFVYGNLHYQGTISQLSDMRFKHVIEHVCLSSEIIANAPLFRYKRKGSEDDRVYIGSSAQYWQEVAPELTPLVDDYLTLDYSTLGVAMGKSNATEIELLKERLKILEAKVENYERILGII